MVMKRNEKISGLTEGGRQKNLRKKIDALEHQGWRYVEYLEAGHGKSTALFEKDEPPPKERRRTGMMILMVLLGLPVVMVIAGLCSESPSQRGRKIQSKQVEKRTPPPQPKKPAREHVASSSKPPEPPAEPPPGRSGAEEPKRTYLDAAEVTKKWEALGRIESMKQRIYLVDELDEKWVRWTGTYVKTGESMLDEGLHWFLVEGVIVMVEAKPAEALLSGKTYEFHGEVVDNLLLPDHELGKPRTGESFSFIIVEADQLRAVAGRDRATAKQADELLGAIAEAAKDGGPGRPAVKPIGVTYRQVLEGLGEEFTIQPVQTGEVPQRFIGTTEDSLALIEITGEKSNILKVTLAYALPVDQKDIALRNNLFAVKILMNCDPTWTDALQWVVDHLPPLLDLPGARIGEVRGKLRVEAEFSGELKLMMVTVRHKD